MDPLTPLETPEKLARFLAAVGAPPDEAVPLIAADFPDEDARRLFDEAVAAKSRDESELEALAGADDERARAAETDLSKTMHGRG